MKCRIAKNCAVCPLGLCGIGANWKKNTRRKMKLHQTVGRSKGESCKASATDRYMARHNRSYRHPGYSNWVSKCRSMNNGKGKR